MTEKVYKNKTPFGTVYPEIYFQCRKIWGVNCETWNMISHLKNPVSFLKRQLDLYDIVCDFDSKYPNKKVLITNNNGEIENEHTH